MKRVYLLIILFACFTGCTAKAQEIPAKIKGDWAMPDCRNVDEALMITGHFYLKSTREGTQFWLIDPVERRKDYDVLTIEGQPRPIRREEDGVLRVGLMAEGASFTPAWNDLMLDARHEYMNCADAPTMLPSPLVEIMAHIDEIDATCGKTMDGECRALLFEIVDQDKSKSLSPREVKNAILMTSYFAAVIKNRTATREILDTTAYDALRDITGLQRDLSYEEAEAMIPGAYTLNKNLTTISDLFPAFAPQPHGAAGH